MGALFLGLALGACTTDTVAPIDPATGDDAAGLFWALTLDHQAITLSTVPPHDTIRLTATPRTAKGEPLTGLGQVIFTSGDPERVQVTPDGLVRALKPAADIRLTAELAAGNVRHTAEAVVSATSVASPPTLTSIHFLTLPPDGPVARLNGDGAALSIAAGGTVNPGIPLKIVPVQQLDENMLPIPGLQVSYGTSDSSVAAPFPLGPAGVALISKKPGRFVLSARATAYGVTRVDSVAFATTMPIWAVVKIVKRPVGIDRTPTVLFDSHDVTIAPGGTVIWLNLSGEAADIVFEDPADVEEHGTISCARAQATDVGGAGDVPAFGEPQDPAALITAENCRSRRFPVAGVYTYRNTLTGAKGRIVVDDGLTAP